MKSDFVSVRCKCGTQLQVPAGGKRLCACGSWVAAPPPAPVAEEPMVVAKAEDAPVARAAPAAVPTATAAPAVATSWPRIEGDLSAIERLNDGYRRITKELAKTIVGQTEVIEQLLIAVFARGHCLLVGVPGLAKTLMIRALSDALNLSFSRIQFTPDLMPSDITGTEVLQEDKTSGQRMFKFLPGPIFSNVILADEINRTPPKTQAALLEAMQEKQVTIGGNRHKLPEPFFVLATQNPIEQEGTYPLPEAQQDRFMFNVLVDYPSEEEEFKIVELTTATHAPKLDRILAANDILEMQDIVRKVPVAPYVIRYAMKFARLTRKEKGEVPDFIKEYVTWGAGPRATQNLVLGAKARAVLHGRYYVSCEDIRAVSIPVLRHRIITNFNAEAEGIKPETIIQRLADIIPRDPNEEALARGKAPVAAVTA
jgi:MoxR-like ATPase